MLSNFYFLNLMFKNNWIFFFTVEDFFFKDLKIFESLFFIDFSYFYNINFNFSYFFNSLKLKFITIFLKKIKKKKKHISLKYLKLKFFILISKGLFFFFKPYEKFLFFRSNFVWFFCLKSGFLKKRNIFIWSRVKKMLLSFDKLSNFFFFKPYKSVAQIYGLKFNNLKFLNGDIFFYVYKKKIWYIKILNYYWKLVDVCYDFFNTHVNFFFNSNFNNYNNFFFKLQSGYLKFILPKKYISFSRKFLSSYKSQNKNFYFYFLDRCTNLFNKKFVTINKKYFAIFKSLKFIWEFLINLINLKKILYL